VLQLSSTNCILHSARLAEILRHQAALYEHIITDQRYYSDYFRVVFYGDFPDALRNKQFIVRLLTISLIYLLKVICAVSRV
jgi:hypothetical protein